MKNPKYHLYLTPDERRTVINSLIDLRNVLISRGRYTDIIDELLVKFTKAKVKKIKVKSICMKKSLIEINRPETMRFLSYAELADHLEMVRDATEWKMSAARH